MKKFLTLTLGVLCALATITSARAQKSGKPTTPEQEVKGLDLSWHQAVAANEADAVGRLLAEDYRFNLDATKTLTKAQEVEAVKGSNALFDFGRFKLDGVTVRVEGDRAIVSGILITKPNGGDKKLRRRYFYTRTFANADGRWQATGSRLVTLWSDLR